MVMRYTLWILLLGATLCSKGWLFAGDFPVADLAAWWPADGSAQDMKGTAHGTLYNGASFVTGVQSQAFSLDGLDDRISAPDVPMLWSNAFSIEAWVFIKSYFGSQDFGWGMIFFRGDDRNGLDSVFLATQQQDSTVYFHIENDQGMSANLLLPAPTNQWVHLLATFDAGRQRMELFLNGQLALARSTTVVPLQWLDSSFPGGIGIGNHSGFPGTAYNMSFNGFVDNLRVYSRALSAREARRLYCLDGGLPSLTIQDAADRASVEWPWTTATFALEVSSSASSLSWQRFPGNPQLGPDGFFKMVVPKTNNAAFFRLSAN